MNYEDMNKHQINKLVARSLGVEWIAVASDGLIIDGQSASVDYCNNPSDAWPVIVENKINITYHSDGDACAEVFCESTNDWVSVACKKPLRSAMICFLKMKDAEL